jgi:hypothetical protein
MKKLSVLLLLTAIGACGDDKNVVVDGSGSGSGSGSGAADAPGPAVYKQVEHLARPGINEALLFTFAYNNGYNATAPSFAGVDTATLGLVVGEAKTVLKAIYLGVCVTNGLAGFTAAQGLHPAGLECAAVGGGVFSDAGGTMVATAAAAGAQAYADKVFSQFEPDVMRIDTAGASSYLTLCGDAASTPLLCGGRKLTDDVIDVTYDYLLAGAAAHLTTPSPQLVALTSDGVVYDNSSVAASNPLSLSTPDPSNRQQGHPATTATFPYSAPPI